MKNIPVAKRTQKDWDSIYDAEALARAEIIREDGPRFKKAVDWAKILVKEEKGEFKAMEKIANA